jgi:hypothetical protein
MNKEIRVIEIIGKMPSCIAHCIKPTPPRATNRPTPVPPCATPCPKPMPPFVAHRLQARALEGHITKGRWIGAPKNLVQRRILAPGNLAWSSLLGSKMAQRMGADQGVGNRIEEAQRKLGWG